MALFEKAPEEKGKNETVYRDGGYTLGWKNETPFLAAGGKTYLLSCHPFDPCLYIREENGALTAVRGAFDPDGVLHALKEGQTVSSITGRAYGARDFCRMVEYAAKYGCGSIDEAEKVFGQTQGDEKECAKAGRDAPKTEKNSARGGGTVIKDDRLKEALARLPACVVDYRLVKNDGSASGVQAHRRALERAAEDLFREDEEDEGWRFDAAKAEAKRIGVSDLFAPRAKNGALNYRAAFLDPPHGRDYPAGAFERINALLFPLGTEELEVYEWTTDWSDYFDDGHEWWGALCLTVYDRRLDRFIVIFASATD